MTLRDGRRAPGARATRQRRLLAWCAQLALAGVLADRAASAQVPPGLSLEWSAPEGCPDGAALRARVDGLLGGAVESRLARPLAVRATLTRSATGADVLLQTTDGGLHGERALHGASCDEVTSAVALVLALTVDPKAVAEHSPEHAVGAFDAPQSTTPQAAPCPAPSPPAPPPAPIVVRVPVPTPTPAEGSASLDAGVVTDIGSLPGPSVGPTLRIAAASRRFGARLGVAYLAPRFGEVPPEVGKPTRGADVSLVTASLLGCYALLPGAIALHACVGLETGALFAEGIGFQRTNAALEPWLGGAAGLELTGHVAGPLSVTAGLGAIVPFGRSPVRFRSTVDNTSELKDIHRPSVVSGRATVTAGVSFF